MTEKAYKILDIEPDYHAVVIFWPTELPIPCFAGKVGDRRVISPPPNALYKGTGNDDEG